MLLDRWIVWQYILEKPGIWTLSCKPVVKPFESFSRILVIPSFQTSTPGSIPLAKGEGLKKRRYEWLQEQ
jgi:hypothetical protein